MSRPDLELRKSTRMTGAGKADKTPLSASSMPIPLKPKASGDSAISTDVDSTTAHPPARAMSERNPNPSRRTSILRRAAQTILPLMIVAGGYVAFKYLVGTRPPPPVKPVEEKAFSISSKVVERRDYQPTIQAFGKTVAGRKVDIRSLVSGQIVETGTDLREGGILKKGDIIVKIDPLDYETALGELKAQLDEAEARREELKSSLTASEKTLSYLLEQQKLAKTDLERAKPLVKRGAVSERSVDDRRQALLQRQQAADEIKNNLNVWEARIKQQIATKRRLERSIERAERRLTETELRAPYAAFVSEVSAQVGRIVSNNDKIATLTDSDWIEASFTLSDEQYGRIVAQDGQLAGRPIKVNWVLGQTTFSYEATVERIAAEINSTSGGLEVFARIKTPQDPVPLRPGAFVEISIPDKVFKNSIRVPASALYEGDTVYAIVDGRLDGRKVSVIGGIESDLIVSGNLASGDKILVSRISTPGNGIKVVEADKP